MLSFEFNIKWWFWVIIEIPAKELPSLGFGFQVLSVLFSVLFGTLKLDSRPQPLLATQGM